MILSLQQVNLLGPHLLPRRVPFPARAMLLLLAVLSALELAAYAWVRHEAQAIEPHYEQALARRDALQAEADARQNAVPAESAGAAAPPDLKRLLETIGQTLETPAYAARLEALGRAALPGVWLTRIELEAGEMRLEGRSLEAEAIAAYLRRIEAQPELDDLPVRHWGIAGPKEEGPGYAFSINPQAQR